MMTPSHRKATTDLLSVALVVAAIVSGFVLHSEVWHMHVYDNTTVWTLHEVIGLFLAALVGVHCVQHSFWFKNYSCIKPDRKRVTTIFLIVGIIVLLSGLVLMFGSRSELISHIHYACGILFTILAIGHILKRHKLLRSLF